MRPSPTARAAAILTSLLALLCLLPGVAAADSASLSFTDAAGTVDPAVGVGRTYTVTGTVSAPTRLFVGVRPAGGASCAPSRGSDSSSGSNSYVGSFDGDDFIDVPVEGNFTLRKTGTWSTPGTFQFCIWLAPSESAATVPIAQIITFRNSNGTISATTAPLMPAVSEATTITVTGTTEAPAEVYATVRPAGGAPCAVSYAAESGRGLINGRDVNGTFTTSTSYSPPAGGQYLICLFLAQSSSDPSPIAVQPITFTAVAPCVVPTITIGSSLSAVQASLNAAGCALGAQTLKPDGKVARGAVIATTTASGTKLGGGTAIGVTISDGKSCHVPASKAGLRLSKAKAKLVAVGCTVGKVKRVKSKRKKGTIVRFTPRGGTTLAPRTAVGIQVSRGRR